MIGDPSLMDFIRGKHQFLADPGCDPDIGELENIIGGEGGDTNETLEAWFDLVIARFSRSDTVEVFRHITIDDFDHFTNAVDNGATDFGDHWSDNPAIWSHYAGALGVDILISGTISMNQIDWLTTFQRQLAFPAEREMVFHGNVELRRIEKIDGSSVWEAPAGRTPAGA